MKKTALALMALALFGLFLAAHDRDYDVQEKEEISKTLKVADASQAAEVIVDNVWGSVKVEGTSGQDVILTAQKTILAESTEKLQKAKEEVKLDITEKGNTLDIYVDGPFRCRDSEGRGIHMHKDPGYIVQYDFALKVPFRTKLVIFTVNEGNIEVKNVEGDFEVENVNGEVYSDFPVTYLPAASAVRGETKGKVVFKSDRFFGVRAGKGGPEIKMDTLNGDILIKKRTV
jgi:hypothetical protein